MDYSRAEDGKGGEQAMVEIRKGALSPLTSGFVITRASASPPQHTPELRGNCFEHFVENNLFKKAKRCVILFGVSQK